MATDIIDVDMDYPPGKPLSRKRTFDLSEQSVTALDPDLQAALKEFDLDGDGKIDHVELKRAAKLFSEGKIRESKLLKALGLLGLGFTIMLVLNIVLTLVIVDSFTSTSVDSDSSELRTKDGEHVIRTANSEYMVDKDNRLVARGLKATDGDGDGSGELYESTLTVGAQLRTYNHAVKSCMPNFYFAQLKSFQMSDGLVHMQLDVLGFVRMPRVASYFGTVVMLITHLGRIVIDGDTLSFVDDIGHVFEEAGFEVDTGSRRLLSLLELLGFFNSIPAEPYECFRPSTDGPKPTFPGSYSVNVKTLLNCHQTSADMAILSGNMEFVDQEVDRVDQCQDVSDDAGDGLAVVNGERYAVGYGTVHISVDENRSREEWYLPLRSHNTTYVAIEMNGVTFTFMHTDPELDGNFPSMPTDSTLAKTGYWCDDAKTTGLRLQDIFSSDEGYNAAYRGRVNGVEGLEMHDEARHWVLYLKYVTAYVFHMYDVPMSTGASAGGYQPVRLELWDVENNVMTKVWLLGLMNAFDMSTATSWASFNKPSECYQIGEALDATGQTVAATSHPAGPGAGVIPLEQWLSTRGHAVTP